MNLAPFFKSIVDQDRSSVVICDTEHTIVYMNPAAVKNYYKHNNGQLVGMNIKNCHNPQSVEIIDKVVEWFKADKSHNMIHTFKNPKQNKDVYMVALRDDDGEFIGYYEKHEFRNAETATPYDFEHSLV